MMRISPTRSSSPPRGYTLAELVVVLAILAVAMSVAITRLDGLLPKYRLRSAARNVGNTIRWWRAQALAEGEGRVIVVDRESGRYWLDVAGERISRRTLPEGTAFASVTLGGNEAAGRTEVVVGPSGVIAPLTINVTDGEKSITVDCHPLLNKVEYR